MAETCRIPIGTLLLCLFWLPSGTGDSFVLRTKPGHTAGETLIAQLILRLDKHGCKGAREVLQGAVEMSQSHYENHTVAERYIIDLLIEFVTSNCTVDPNRDLPPIPDVNETAIASTPDLGYSIGKRYLIRLLSIYVTLGCSEAAKEVPKDWVAGQIDGSIYSVGERRLIDHLTAYILRGCKAETELAPSVQDDSRNTAGRHLQSVVLELFLLIFGVCLTRIDI